MPTQVRILDLPLSSKLFRTTATGLRAVTIRGAQLIELIDALAESVAGAVLKIGGIDGGNLQPAQLAQLQMTRLQAQDAKRILDRLNAKRAVIGGDADTDWTRQSHGARARTS